MIQIISNNYSSYNSIFDNTKVENNSFNGYKSFDLYEINIIDLSDSSLWCYFGNTISSIDKVGDISHIKNSINTSNSKIILVMPQNYTYYYHYDSVWKKYNKNEQIKNVRVQIKNIIQNLIFDNIPCFEYDKSVTEIDGEQFFSDFYFTDNEIFDNVIECKKSKKVNTIKYKKAFLVITTLDIFKTIKDHDTFERLNLFLKRINFINKEEIIPDWVKDISFYDDETYIKNIANAKKEINSLNEKISENEKKLHVNNSYKKILYSFGKELSNQINDMLRHIFQIDDNFDDLSEEDFRFKYNDVTFIVETKGLTNEVAGKNVSDAYDHLVIYEDELEKKKIKEKTKCLFFVANERLKNPKLRVPIKDRQITIAKRNNTLIIDTQTFYNIFEDFCKSKITTEDFFNIINEQFGLMNYKANE